ncbi:Pyruvate/Phosphoenolpyruvate kinase-like domain-containing protein [Chytriomyces cf. hyalinus JEL632]|nr:Pyruvate/Phosphoenolpyruvate kinase-like domain-containing protein [Chytriomyces cf. hyalinus JEL632]
MSAKLNAFAKRLSLMHKPGKPVILANVCDGISAKGLRSTAGAQAAVTASYAIAAACGVADADLSLEQNLAAIGTVHRVLGDALPLTVEQWTCKTDTDTDWTRQDAPIEDIHPGDAAVMPAKTMAARITRARAVAAECGVPDFVVWDGTRLGARLDDVISRGNLYFAAGQLPCFPGRLGQTGNDNLADLGVCRISTGPALMYAKMDLFKRSAAALFEGGSLHNIGA